MESTNEPLIKQKKKESKIPLILFFITFFAKLFIIIYLLLTKLPKRPTKFIDLHLHLDGAITIDIAKKLAKLQNIPLECKNDEELQSKLSVKEDCESLNEFLDCFTLANSLLQTKEGISEAIKLIAENIYNHGVIYAEIRFAPQKHKEKGLSQEDAIKAALDGLNKIKENKIPIKINLILCFMRGDNNDEDNKETLKLAEKYLVKDNGVVAVDLAGAEALFKTHKYEELFKEVKKFGIPFTIHAGEADGPESVKKAIEFGAARIGHGTRAYFDKNVLELIIEKGIFLEMCPTSNRLTRAIENMKEYPFMDYLKQGIFVTLNTDDMGIERTTIQKEFEYMEKEFNLNYEQEKIILLNSVNAAFTSDGVKEELKKQLGL